ncbi:MAG: helix-turn-helix domain-containing protein [Christensenella sp.]
MEFKDLIKTKRLHLNKTLEEIGNAVGVSKATVQRWESGEIKNIRRDKIGNLANALEVSPDYIMGWGETSQKSIFGDNPQYEKKPTTENGSELDTSEQTLIDTYRDMTPKGQKVLLDTAETLHENFKRDDCALIEKEVGKV